ncbi:MAG: 16S rRNA (guanine(966)-N(2))-methyltransferase RsmD [Armatimonadetes bacterium]|nr:16S rRNA (guanine(966)-N(2))-methyltransferase RsmD [Armatimonadota bacterium]
MSRGLRVIAGDAGSLPLKVPAGADIRPTTDGMRETLFASLATVIQGARFADLYAGSGAVGIEALSRGAELAVFVDSDSRCTEVIGANLANTNLAEGGIVVRGRLPAVWTRIAQGHGPFDIVFADPPYDSPDVPELAERLVVSGEGVVQGGIVVIQHDRNESLLRDIEPHKVKKFGQSRLDFYHLGASE